jgi:uncharacterized membrane protein
MDKNTKDMLDALDFIKQRMATKDEIADLKATMATKDDVNSISNELTSIRRDLEALTDKVDNIVGLPKEIDHALERIAAIEKHLGINKKIAA